MAGRKKRFRYESLQDSKSIQGLLKAITSGIAKGKLTFTDEDEKIVLRPEGMLDLKVTAAQEDNYNRFTIKVSWQVESSREDRKKTLSVK